MVSSIVLLIYILIIEYGLTCIYIILSLLLANRQVITHTYINLSNIVYFILILNSIITMRLLLPVAVLNKPSKHSCLRCRQRYIGGMTGWDSMMIELRIKQYMSM